MATQPTHFFEKQLSAEEAPSFATMQRLYDLARELFGRRPWDRLSEDELVLVEGAVTGELCFCSVMGALGELRALHAYIGSDGYRFFKRIYSGEAISAGEFIATQRSVNVDFVRLSDLTVPDRDLLKAVDGPLKRGTLVPIFRSSRLGYHPWYVTEDEARILAECQQALILICDRLEADPKLDYWEKQNVFPMVSGPSKDCNEEQYHVRLVDAPRLPVPMPTFASLDETRIQRIRQCRYAVRGTLEVDHFYGTAMIGEKHQRKACLRMTLAIDAQSGFAYPLEASLPTSPTADALSRVVLQAIESAGTLPREIHVRSGEFKVLLEPLARALGCSVRTKDSLPALDFAKSCLQEMMGDPGQLPSL